jgi:hypothetical protein
MQQYIQASNSSSASGRRTNIQAAVASVQKQQGHGALGVVQAAAGLDGEESDAASDSSEEEWRQMRQQRRGAAAGRLLGA